MAVSLAAVGFAEAALGSYVERKIENGKIDAHLRKARRVYLEKSKILLDSVAAYLPQAAFDFNETALYLVLRPPFAVDRAKLEEELSSCSVRLMNYERSENAFALSFSGIAHSHRIQRNW